MNLETQQRLYDALKRIGSYKSVEWLQKHGEKTYGVVYEEVIEMAYENVIEEARAAIKGIRKPKLPPSSTQPGCQHCWNYDTPSHAQRRNCVKCGFEQVKHNGEWIDRREFVCRQLASEVTPTPINHDTLALVRIAIETYFDGKSDGTSTWNAMHKARKALEGGAPLSTQRLRHLLQYLQQSGGFHLVGGFGLGVQEELEALFGAVEEIKKKNHAYVELVCPFCEEKDFDAIGLKLHLIKGDCDKFNDTPTRDPHPRNPE